MKSNPIKAFRSIRIGPVKMGKSVSLAEPIMNFSKKKDGPVSKPVLSYGGAGPVEANSLVIMLGGGSPFGASDGVSMSSMTT